MTKLNLSNNWAPLLIHSHLFTLFKSLFEGQRGLMLNMLTWCRCLVGLLLLL